MEVRASSRRARPATGADSAIGKLAAARQQRERRVARRREEDEAEEAYASEDKEEEEEEAEPSTSERGDDDDAEARRFGARGARGYDEGEGGVDEGDEEDEDQEPADLEAVLKVRRGRPRARGLGSAGRGGRRPGACRLGRALARVGTGRHVSRIATLLQRACSSQPREPPAHSTLQLMPLPSPCTPPPQMQLRRNQLEEWYDKPFFDTAVKGCVVRISYGPPVIDPATGQQVPGYMMMRVSDVAERQPYRWAAPRAVPGGGNGGLRRCSPTRSGWGPGICGAGPDWQTAVCVAMLTAAACTKHQSAERAAAELPAPRLHPAWPSPVFGTTAGSPPPRA